MTFNLKPALKQPLPVPGLEDRPLRWTSGRKLRLLKHTEGQNAGFITEVLSHFGVGLPEFCEWRKRFLDKGYRGLNITKPKPRPSIRELLGEESCLTSSHD